MNIVLLSGGSGKRLWPLSNDIRSKQFIKIFKTDTGYESMVQRVYRQIKAVEKNATITIATSKSQVSSIRNQLGEDVNICVEPCRRDTFPAIVLATAYLRDVVGVSEDEAVVVCPVDSYADENFFRIVQNLGQQVEQGDANLVLMGIEPTYPSEKYGYIIPENKNVVSKVRNFKEKPDAVAAKRYIEQGALWNGGVFAYKVSYVLDKAHELLGFVDYEDLYARYNEVEKISFDYAVVEREPQIEVLRYEGQWKDLGTWNTLTEAMEEATVGNVILNEACSNTHVINELSIPVLCMGLENCVVAVSADGVLVSDKEQSGYIKPYVDKIDQQVMYAEKSWGSYQVIDIQEESISALVTVHAGQAMNYHSHESRDEVWTVIAGTGIVIIDEVERKICKGDVVTMPAGCKHTVIAEQELKLIEVQLGKDINVGDKHKYSSTFVEARKTII